MENDKVTETFFKIYGRSGIVTYDFFSNKNMSIILKGPRKASCKITILKQTDNFSETTIL